MAKIYNTKVIKRILKDAKIQTSVDDVPDELAGKIVPVLISNPLHTIIITNATCSDDNLELIFTASATKKTFISAAILTYTKDVVSDSLSSDIRVIMKTGLERKILVMNYEPLTAGSSTITLAFPVPIELKCGEQLKVANSTATASIDTSATVFYYEEDLENAS